MIPIYTKERVISIFKNAILEYQREADRIVDGNCMERFKMNCESDAACEIYIDLITDNTVEGLSDLEANDTEGKLTIEDIGKYLNELSSEDKEVVNNILNNYKNYLIQVVISISQCSALGHLCRENKIPRAVRLLSRNVIEIRGG